MTNPNYSVSQGLERAPVALNGARWRRLKLAGPSRHYYTLVAAVSWVYIQGTDYKHALVHAPSCRTQYTRTNIHPRARTTRKQDNGVCECGGAAPGSAQTGLGTAALQTGQRQKENHPAEEVVLGEDDFQEKRGMRVVRNGRAIGSSSLVSGTSWRNNSERRDDAGWRMRSSCAT